MRRLVPDDAAAGGGDPDRAGGVGAERCVREPGGDRGRRAAARAARDAAGEAWVGHVAEVRVLGGRAVRELVQIRLADVRVAGLLEQPHRGRRLAGHVPGEDRRAVGRLEPGRVEEILDGEPDPGRRWVRPGEEDVTSCRLISKHRPHPGHSRNHAVTKSLRFRTARPSQSRATYRNAIPTVPANRSTKIPNRAQPRTRFLCSSSGVISFTAAPGSAPPRRRAAPGRGASSGRGRRRSVASATAAAARPSRGRSRRAPPRPPSRPGRARSRPRA